MGNYLIVWPKSEDVVHINYHYTQFGEVVDYLNKHVEGSISAIDCDVQDIDVYKYIEQHNISKVALEVNYENARNAFVMAERIKENYGIPILAYGSIPFMHPKLFLNSSFDAIFNNGDFEICIQSFLEAFQADGTDSEMQEKLKGAFLVRDNLFLATQKGEEISPDEWGISRKESVPVAEYDKKKNKNRYVINLSRGCPFGCQHCLIQLTEGEKERRRSIPNLREALKDIQTDYSHLKIWAANFTLNRRYVDEFYQMMKEEFPGLTWECATRIDLVKDSEMLKNMHDAGCRQISLGIEGLNNGDMIAAKRFTPEVISSTINNIQAAGIVVKGCVMLGMPNQTKEDIVNTFRFLEQHGVIVRPTIYTPYHHISESPTIDELAQYNRKSFENKSVPGVSSQQLIELVKNPRDYRRILGLSKEYEEIRY